jgi:ParB family chromosome partitioning protein
MGDGSAITAPAAFISGGIKKSPGVADGQPLEIDLSLIAEDPNQPRKEDNPGFSAESLAELADSIRQCGIKQPISLRLNIEQPGHYTINHGARRYRATKLANLPSIPAFIDQNYTEFDQIVENLHRNELTPREIADFISREVNNGFEQKEIAKRIGKSKAFVSQHLALMDLPKPIAMAFNSGRAQDVTAINDLVRLHKTHATAVEQWLGHPDTEVTRKTVKEMRDRAKNDGDDELPDIGNGTVADEAAGTTRPKKDKGAPKDNSKKFRKAVVLLKHRDKEARLLYDRRPEKASRVWIRYENGGTVASVEVSALKLVRLFEG